MLFTCRVMGSGSRISVPAAVIVLGILLLLGIAPAAYLAASRLPITMTDPTPIAPGNPTGDPTTLRPLPVGLPAEIVVDNLGTVQPYAVAALGVPGARAFLELISSEDTLNPDPLPGSNSGIEFTYPYRFSMFEPIFSAVPQHQLRSNATALAAALIKLAGATRGDDEKSNAARAAYAVLERTRTSGGCDGALNMMLLVSSDGVSSPAAMTAESQHAETSCPDDPTPAWILGQAQLRMLFPSYDPRPQDEQEWVMEYLTRAIATFEGLVARFPADPAAHTGLGDAYLRSGLRRLSSRPFAARGDLRRAVSHYNNAAEIGATRDADLGRARAFIGLGETERAVTLAQQAVDGAAHPGAALEVLLRAQQDAQDFNAATEVGRRLEAAGVAAYPPPAIFLPTPRVDGPGLPFETGLPLSTGAGTLHPLAVSLAPTGGAGGSVDDLSFIPVYRDDRKLTSTMVDTPSMAWRRDAIVAGRGPQLLAEWPAQFTAVRPNAESYAGSWARPNDELRAIAELAAHQQVSGEYITTEDAFDGWQNLLRWAGDLPGAQVVAERWRDKAGEDSATPWLRLGEIAFLRGKYDDSAAYFGDAARQARLADPQDDLAVGQAQLDRGVALFKAGRPDEAIPLLRDLQQLGVTGYGYQYEKRNIAQADQFAALAYHASAQIADHESATGNPRGAIDDYNAALWWVDRLDGNGIRPEVVHNNLALAYLGAGDTDKAQASAAEALTSDPMNPLFLMTAGFAAERAGNSDSAIDLNRQALAMDAGAFAVSNDLGVELARRHDYGAAQTALRQAVGAAPDYALGWFNLGIVESRRGPLRLLASQGAFAKAFALDPALKTSDRELTIDGAVYRTALDLSKPIPPQWSLAQTQKGAPAASVGLLAIAMAGLGLARVSGGKGGELAKQWLDPIAERFKNFRGPTWAGRAVVGVVATAVAFLLTYLRQSGSMTDFLAYGACIVLLVGMAYLARVVVAARREVAVTQNAWTPGLALGVVTGAIGTPWAPLPVAQTSTEARPVHLAGPLILAALSLLLFIEVAWFDVPLTGALAIAALIMTSSMLLPVKPLDGANLGGAGAVAAAGVSAGAVLVALGIA